MFSTAYRYILHNDDNNPLVSSLEALEEQIRNFDADLLVVSGLQMMDNYPFLKGKKLCYLVVNYYVLRNPVKFSLNISILVILSPNQCLIAGTH